MHSSHALGRQRPVEHDANTQQPRQQRLGTNTTDEHRPVNGMDGTGDKYTTRWLLMTTAALPRAAQEEGGRQA